MRETRKQFAREIRPDRDDEFLRPQLLPKRKPEGFTPPAPAEFEPPDLVDPDDVEPVPDRGDDRTVSAGEGLVVEVIPAYNRGVPALVGDSSEQASAPGAQVNKIVSGASAFLEHGR